MGDAEEVWKAGKARKDTDLSAPTFTVADGVGGAGWGWGVKALESGKSWCENGVTEKGLLRFAAKNVEVQPGAERREMEQTVQ
jgi:hypothetical protein